jgi:REP element-mobilizing transposase RayT
MALEGTNRTRMWCIPANIIACGRPKYRRSVLVGPIAKCCEPVMRQTAKKHRAEIIAWEIMPDHVPVLVEVDPQFGIHRLIKNLKAVSSHTLRPEFRTWKSRLPTLWTNRYFVSTVGGAPLAGIKQYVENRKQRESLLATLEVCRYLYNDALQERREAWKLCRKSITFAMQSAQLPACKQADAPMRGVYSQVLQEVLHRVDKTYQAFFRRDKGFPRFKGKGWFDSFTYPQAGFSVEGSQVSLLKIGNVKIRLHRPLAGEVKRLTLKQENGKWYACFSCLVEVEPLPANDSVMGIDVGLESFAVTSAGEIVDNPPLVSYCPKETAGGAAPRIPLQQAVWRLA